jgi:hypothetical protein
MNHTWTRGRHWHFPLSLWRTYLLIFFNDFAASWRYLRDDGQHIFPVVQGSHISEFLFYNPHI